MVLFSMEEMLLWLHTFTTQWKSRRTNNIRLLILETGQKKAKEGFSSTKKYKYDAINEERDQNSDIVFESNFVSTLCRTNDSKVQSVIYRTILSLDLRSTIQRP